MTNVAASVVDAVILDSDLVRPDALLRTLRSPAGRRPSEQSLAVAESLSRIDDADALPLIRATLDAAIFGFFSLLDLDFKDSAVNATFSDGVDVLDTRTATGRFVEAYRDRVDPTGLVREGAAA